MAIVGIYVRFLGCNFFGISPFLGAVFGLLLKNGPVGVSQLMTHPNSETFPKIEKTNSDLQLFKSPCIQQIDPIENTKSLIKEAYFWNKKKDSNTVDGSEIR